MSNNTTKTEMVVEMKLSYKEENAGEGRSLRSRRVMNYTINEKTAIKKKIKSCREVPLEIKMEKGNNLRIFCSTTAFENIRKIIIETVASNYVLEMTENKDISERVIIETIKTKERNARRALPIFVINIYRTTSTLLINGPQVQRFSQEILPVLQSWADQNEKEIDLCDQPLEKMLRKVYPGRQRECSNSSQHDIDNKIKGVNDHNGETQEEENVTQYDREAENETQECDFKIHEHNRNDEEHEQIKENTRIEKEKVAEPENNNEEEIEKNEKIFMVESQSEDYEKKAEVVGKADNEEQATKEQTINKNMILNKDANIESTKSEGEAKIEDEQYGKPNPQCQKHEKVIADKTKTKEMEKENQGDKTAEEDQNHKNTSKKSKLERKHFKLYQENLEDKKIEHNLKEEEQTGNQKQVKGDDTERNIETSSQMTKQKEITLRKNDERERNTGKTKPQKVTEGSEKEICMGCNKYVETGVQCGGCYRWYHYKCEGTTEKEIKKLYPEETHYICKKDQNSELTIKRKNQYELKQKEVETIKRINEKTMKEKEEIKGQFDRLKEQHQKDKLKQQQKENEITKISQEKKILEAVVKTLGNCDRIKINHASDKDQ